MASSEPTFPDYELLGARLRDLRDAWMAEPCAFKPGDLVRWKRGFQMGRPLEPSGLGVVLSVSQVPVRADDADPDGGEYRLPLDVAVGVVDRSDQFGVFRLCGRLLEPAHGESGRVAALLRRTAADFLRQDALEPGLVVRWKPLCAPAGIRPASLGIVVEVLPADVAGTLPVHTLEQGHGQPIDTGLAVEDEDCGFRIVWTDGRRIEPYGGTPLAEPGAEDGPEAVALRLRQRHARWLAEQALPPVGTFVCWKEGLRDRPIPLEDDVALVLGIEESPQTDPGAPVGAPLWRQPLSVALGCMGEDGHFLVCHFDGRRFEPSPNGAGGHRAFLEKAWALYREPHGFARGDLVRWKPGLANRNVAVDEPAIVVGSFDPPLRSGGIDGASPYFREPLDLAVGLREGDEFVVLHVDGARFQPLAPEESATAECEWLRARTDEWFEPDRLDVGDLVEWKEGHCPSLWSDPRDHGIVVERLDPPVCAEGVSAGSPLFRQLHTVRVAFLDEEGDIVMHPVDGRRLRGVAVPDAEQDEDLRSAYADFTEPRTLRPGQIVQWIPGLQGWSFLNLAPTAPGIVLSLLDPPVRAPQAELLAGDFGARADVLVGGFDDDGDFAIVHADSRRLQPHTQPHGATARRLRGFWRRLRQPADLEPGTLVAWKDRLCSHTGLPDGVPGIVLERHAQPSFLPSRQPSTALGSPAFAAPWDTVVGVWTEAGFTRLHCDGRRLEPFDPRIHGEIFRRQEREEARRMDEFSRMLDDFDDDDLPF